MHRTLCSCKYAYSYEAFASVSGCRLHWLESKVGNIGFLFQEDVDAGPIILQEAVPVQRGDTVATLSERVKLAEHKIFPAALQLVASGAVQLGEDGKIHWAGEP